MSVALKGLRGGRGLRERLYCSPIGCRQLMGRAVQAKRPTALVDRSIFELQLNRCSDSAAVLRAASTSNLALQEVDLRAFFVRLRLLGRVPRSGKDLHGFVGKALACVEKHHSGNAAAASTHDAGPSAEVACLAVSSFADLSCRQGLVGAWPFLEPHIGALAPEELAESIWAVSRIQKPTADIMRGLRSIAGRLAPRFSGLSDLALVYRSIYGLARVTRGRGYEEFRKRAEKVVALLLRRKGPCDFSPTHLVRLCWAFARLGSKEEALYDALEARLHPVIAELSERELEALYGIFTRRGNTNQWKLIHDVELAMEDQQDAEDPNKRTRKQPFRKKWTRVSITDPISAIQRR